MLVTPQDPLDPPPAGFTENKTVSVFYRNNRDKLTSSRFVTACASAALPNAIVALCDGQTPKDSSSKRLQKSVNRSAEFLDECIAELEKLDVESKPALFASVTGGRSREWRKRSAEAAAKRSTAVHGFMLDGFFLDSRDKHDVDEVCRIIKEEVMPSLPSDKPKAFFGPVDPRAALALIEVGVDLFDSSFAVEAAEKGLALTYPHGMESGGVLEDLPNAAESQDKENLSEGPWIDLKDSALFREDFSSLVRGCSCPACRRHTRAYVCHLLSTNELLGPALLVSHNLHHSAAFFRAVGRAVDEGSMEKLKEKILKCYDKESPAAEEVDR